MTVDTKGIGDALNTNLQVGTAIRTTQTLDAIAQDNDARQKAEIAKLRATATRSQPSNSSSNYEAMHLRGALHKAEMESAEKDALIFEWMQTNEAFKLLARKYGKQLGMTDEQRQADFDKQILDMAAENPDYEKTRVTERVRAKAGHPQAPRPD